MIRRVLVWLWRRRLRRANSQLELLRRFEQAGVSWRAQFYCVTNPDFLKEMALARRVQALHRLQELGAGGEAVQAMDVVAEAQP
jgi:hypothetical protein